MSESSEFPVNNIAGPGNLVNVHPPGQCEGRPCVVHNPSQHHMVTWPLNWRADIVIMERTCPHGIGHPDPDDLAYYLSLGQDWKSVHGCDGCCQVAFQQPNPQA